MQIRLAAFALMASPIAGKCGEIDMGRRWSQWSQSRLLYSNLPDKNVKYFCNRNIGLQSNDEC